MTIFKTKHLLLASSSFLSAYLIHIKHFWHSYTTHWKRPIIPQIEETIIPEYISSARQTGPITDLSILNTPRRVTHLRHVCIIHQRIRNSRSKIYLVARQTEERAWKMQVDEITDVSMPRVLTRPSKRGNDSFFPFSPRFPPLCLSLSSLSRGFSPFCITAADECETSAELLQPVSASPLHCSARCSPDSWHETAATQRYTRVPRQQKDEKKSFQAMTKLEREIERERERRKMGTKLCFVDGLKMLWGQRERGFMTIRWFPMSRGFHVTEVVRSNSMLSSLWRWCLFFCYLELQEVLSYQVGMVRRK